ncbi:pyroglutamyl-peptidase I [Brachybacterium sp. DNPG3]
MTTQVLLTGFEPFGGDADNPSWEAARRAAGTLTAAGTATAARELPVEFGRAGALLLEAVEELAPRLVIAVGLAAGRSAITPERVAINIRDARIPDNAGASPVDEPVVPGGPVGLFSTLPIKAMVAAVRDDLQLPASVSQTAGTYVCNDVFYLLQHRLAALEGPTTGAAVPRSGFVHIPAADVVPVADAAAALVRMVEVALGTTTDLRRSDGAEH